MIWGLASLASAAVSFLNGFGDNFSQDVYGWFKKKLPWGKVEEKTNAPIVARAPEKESQLFRVYEPEQGGGCIGKIDDKAFLRLVGMERQQSELKCLAAMMWEGWRLLEEIVRDEVRSRIALALFTGCHGSGKTAHARALATYFGIPCVEVNPGNVGDRNPEGVTTIRRVVDYCIERKSAVLLLDEIDVYAEAHGVIAEIRQVVEGALNLPNDAILYVVATTNKKVSSPISQGRGSGHHNDNEGRYHWEYAELPSDLLHRVICTISFDNIEQEVPHQQQSCGWTRKQFLQFWQQNARHLTVAEQVKLSELSDGCGPRDLQLWVQRVLITAAVKPMVEDYVVTCPLCQVEGMIWEQQGNWYCDGRSNTCKYKDKENRWQGKVYACKNNKANTTGCTGTVCFDCALRQVAAKNAPTFQCFKQHAPRPAPAPGPSSKL